jgi:hypothetical protein
MFHFSQIEKKTAISYLKNTINKKKIQESEQEENKNVFDIAMKKNRLQNLILTKSLIVKL